MANNLQDAGRNGETQAVPYAPETTEQGESLSRFQAATRSLRHRNFQLFFAGQLISLIGTWMQTVAQAWLVYRMTGSSLLLGEVGFASQIPVFIFAPVGGILADRLNRHRVVIGTQTSAMVLAGILAWLTLSERVQVWEIFVLAALLGVVNSFDIPARQAFLVDMVGKEDLMNAIALNSSMFNGARVVGPAIAGVVVAKVGEGWCFAGNAISYIAVIVGLLAMRLRPWVRPASPGSPVQNVIEGFRFVRLTAPVRALLLLLGLVSLVGMPYMVLMPIFADRILHSGANGLGILMGAAGVGALMGALTLAARRGLKGLGGLIPVMTAIFGASLILFAYSRFFWLSAALLLPVGFAIMTQMAASNTLIQAMVPDELRGRVMAVYSMMFMGMAPLGALFAGALAHRLGSPLTVAVGGAGCIAAAAAFRLQLPALRVEARQLILAQGMSAGEPPEKLSTPGMSSDD